MAATTAVEKVARVALTKGYDNADMDVAVGGLTDEQLGELVEKGGRLLSVAEAELRKRIALLLEDPEITQAKIARTFGLHQSSISRRLNTWGLSTKSNRGRPAGIMQAHNSDEHAPGETDEEIDAALEGAGVELEPTPEPTAVRYVDVRSSISAATSALEVLALKLEKGAARTNDEADDLLDKVDTLVARIRTELKGTS